MDSLMAFKLPYFPFYVNDFWTDEKVTMMDWDARAMYLKLLCHQWQEGSIPANNGGVAVILQVGKETINRVWPQISPCFVPWATDKTRLVNPRMDAERAKALNLAKISQESGRRGGQERVRRAAMRNGEPEL